MTISTTRIRSRRLVGSLVARLAVAVLATTSALPPARAGDAGFRVKPNEMAPAVAGGGVRRLVQAFGDWTLICDEDLKAKRRVCNVSQVFVDGDGRATFNWSLAATKGRAPVMILRAPNTGADGRDLRVGFGSAPKPRDIRLSSCNAEICLGFLEIGPDLQAAIREGATAEIDLLHEGRFRTLDAPMKGLATALAAVR